MLTTTAAVLLLAASSSAYSGVSDPRLRAQQLGKQLSPQALDLPAKVSLLAAQQPEQLEKEDANGTESKFGPFFFEQKVSHFDDSEKGTFKQRYWVDTQYYVEGGPVYILDGGETSGANRIPFMEQGILQILSNATGGLSVILEHRYYGGSNVTSDLSTDSLRWLNNKESLEDSAEFIRHFPVPKELKKTLKDKHVFDPSKTPYIYYGGSYAGARAAFMRTEYEDIVWGGIGSSGVTHAQVYYPQYFDPIIQYGDPACIGAMEESIASVDELLDKSDETNHAIKQVFGLKALNDIDFANVLMYPTGDWQAQNWDPAVGSDDWNQWCRALTTSNAQNATSSSTGPTAGNATTDSTSNTTDTSAVNTTKASNESDPTAVSSRANLTVAGMSVPASLFNYADYIREQVIRPSCPDWNTQECFGTGPDSEYQNTSLAQTWRLWTFQVCTQWGYFQCAPKEGKRTIVSRKVTLDSTARICKQAFPPGEHFTVPVWPDVHETNSRGSFYIAADRLAFIDGEIDPWRPVTPNSDVAPRRDSTTLRPNHIIPRGVHHYDENGLKDHSKEPEDIKWVHQFMIDFVRSWLKDWEDEKKGNGNGHGNGHGGHGNGHGHGHGDGHGHGHGNGKDHGHKDGHGNDKGKGNDDDGGGN